MSQWLTRFDNYCYLVSSSIKTCDQAQEYRESLGAAWLVKINNPEENEFVLNLVTKKAPSLKQVSVDRAEMVYKQFLLSGTITRFQCTQTGQQMNPVEKRKNHADKCGWMDTRTLFPSEQLVHGMILDVM